MDNCNDFYAVVLFLVLLFCFPSDVQLKTDEFKPVNCTSDDQCEKLCFQGGNLESLCDDNGTCVCDCSDKTIVTSSHPKPCDEKQPDGYWRDYCDRYCNQEYLRPFRYCKNPTSEPCCTCVCVYPHP